MARTKLIHDRLTYSVIGAFVEVYYTLGFGFLEHVYVASLTREPFPRDPQFPRVPRNPVVIVASGNSNPSVIVASGNGEPN